MAPPDLSRFARDTAVADVGAGIFEATIDRGWWIERGPNGGYVGALLARALTEAVAAPDRPLRSFTVHYLRPPGEGPAVIHTVIERTGRSLTSASARLHQGDRLLAVAMAAFSASRPAVEFVDVEPPVVPPPEEIPPPPADRPTIPMGERYEMRWAIGPLPFSGGAEARAGGWIRLARDENDDHPLDATLLVALSDAWVPPIFGRVSSPVAVPTVDLTVHLRSRLPVGYDDWCLVEFHTTAAVDGFVEEDGRIWSRDGLLLAQSRQLAVALPLD